MKRFWVLTRLEIKKYKNSFPGFLLAAIALLVIVSGIAMTGQRALQSLTVDSVDGLVDDMTSGQLGGSAAKQDSDTDADGSKYAGNGKISVAIVVQDTSKAVDIAKTMLENIESVNSALEIRYVDEEEGERLLKEGKIVVLMIVRAKTISGIMNGKNIPVEIKFPENSGYEAAVFKEFADAAVAMLSSAQAAIYSVYDFYEDYDKYDLKDGAIERLNMKYISAILIRESTFSETEVVVTGELTISQYYICGGIALFLMFLAMMAVSHMRRSSSDIAVRLKQSGTGYTAQVTSAVVGLTTLYMVLALLAATVLSLVKKLQPDLVSMVSYQQIWYAVVLMIPASLVVSAFSLLVCRLTNHVFAQIMLLFLSALLQGFVSGCFVPKLLLPDIMDSIARYLPAHAIMEGFSQIFLGKSPWQGITAMLLYTIVFMALTVLVEMKVNKNLGGRRKNA
jgi:hypothetical protein